MGVIVIANLYVAKDGSDSNTGADWANALLTIGAAVSASASGDTIYIGGGTYNESIGTMTSGRTFRGVGRVQISGAALGTGFLKAQSDTGVWTFYDIEWTDWSGNILAQSGTYYVTFKLYRCRFASSNATWAVYAGGNNTKEWRIENCLFLCPYGVSRNSGSFTPNTVIIGSTLHCATSAVVLSGSKPLIQNCLISASLLLSAGAISDSDYNCLDFDGGNNNTTIGGTDYTSLSAHQAGTGYDANSLDSDPATELIDTAKGLYMLRPTSQLVRRGSAGGNIGWGGPALGASANINTTIWNNPYTVSGSVQKNASGHWELASGTSATIRFGDGSGNAMDLGASRTIRKVLLSVAETYPGSVIDYDTADSAPRQLTYRYKTAASTFLLSDNTGWTEVNRETDLLISADDRYFALEVTLRQDGV